MGVNWDLTVVLIFIFLMADDKYFSQFVSVLFIFLRLLLEAQKFYFWWCPVYVFKKIFIVAPSWIYFCCCVVCAFGVQSKNLCLTQDPKDFTPMFSSRCVLIVPALTFRSLISFWAIFCMWRGEGGPTSFFCMWRSSCPSTTRWESHSFPFEWPWRLVYLILINLNLKRHMQLAAALDSAPQVQTREGCALPSV